MVRRASNRKISSGCAVKLEAGSCLSDRLDQSWLLGNPMAAGGFGDIYSISKDFRKSSSSTPYVAKVECHSSGPLFVELNFYLRVGREEYIEEHKKLRKLKHLGMPYLIAFGSHPANDTRYRFLVLNRYGSNIWSLFLKNGRRFSLKSTLAIAIQILDVLEYIHHFGYIHADIKGSNILLGLGRGGENRVYLIDFGLSCRFVNSRNEHKEFSTDMRRAHDGTLEYTSRDAHVGAHSRRGDIETLAYNVVQWLCGELPWESSLRDPDTVAAAKNMYMSNTKLFMNKCFPRGGPPAVVQRFVDYVTKMEFTTMPDYNKLRQMLRKGLQEAGLSDDGKLQLQEPITSAGRTDACGYVTYNTENWRRIPKKTDNKNKTMCNQQRKPCTPVQVCDRKTRLKSLLISKEFDWVKVLQSNPEKNAKRVSKEKKERKSTPRVVEKLHRSMVKEQENPRDNPTPAMLEVMGWQTAGPRAARRVARSDSVRCGSNLPLTPAMEDVIRRRAMREKIYLPPMTAMQSRRERMLQKKVDSDTPTRCLRGRRPVQGEPPVRSSLRVRQRVDYREQSPEESESQERDYIVKTECPESRWTEKVDVSAPGHRTRQYTRSDPRQRPPITGMSWRPPTPPRQLHSPSTLPKFCSPRHPPAPRKRKLLPASCPVPVSTRLTRGMLAKMACQGNDKAASAQPKRRKRGV